MSNKEIVRASVAAFQTQDRDAAAELLAPDFVFSSPQDDRIDKFRYLEVCFPTAGRFLRDQILELTELDDERVFLLYEYELVDGGTYRNVELITVHEGHIRGTQV
jgi:ketosteroid isomerase-like protein